MCLCMSICVGRKVRGRTIKDSSTRWSWMNLFILSSRRSVASVASCWALFDSSIDLWKAVTPVLFLRRRLVASSNHFGIWSILCRSHERKSQRTLNKFSVLTEHNWTHLLWCVTNGAILRSNKRNAQQQCQHRSLADQLCNVVWCWLTRVMSLLLPPEFSG